MKTANPLLLTPLLSMLSGLKIIELAIKINKPTIKTVSY